MRELFHKRTLRAWYKFTVISGPVGGHRRESPGWPPTSQVLQLRRACVPLNNIHRDVGVSGTPGTQERRGWHQLNSRLAGGDTLVVVVAIDRIGRRWPDTVKSICELRYQGVKVRSLSDAEKEWTPYLEADPGTSSQSC